MICVFKLVDESSVEFLPSGRRKFSGRREFCTPLVVESSVVDESSVFGRREFCPKG